MHIHEVTYSTNNNIYLTASYAKIVIVKGHDLICKPTRVTSLCLGYVILRFSYTSWIAIFFSKTFWIAVDSEYISYNIETKTALTWNVVYIHLIIQNHESDFQAGDYIVDSEITRWKQVCTAST